MLRITDIQDERVNWDGVPFCEIDEAQIKRFRLSNGDIVFARTGATTGKSYLIYHCPDSVFASYLIRVRPGDSISPPYLASYFGSVDYWNKITENLSGSAQPNCNASKLSELIVPLPPLAEQRRIVGVLEGLLGKVAASRERLARVPQLLKRFRQSVLAAACSGKLTSDWREENPDVELASELLKRLEAERQKIWNAKYGNRRKYQAPAELEDNVLDDIPDTWCWTNFDHCSSEITVGHVGPMKDRYTPTGVSFLRSQNVRPLRFDTAGLVHIPYDFHSALSKSALYGGEILVVHSGANTGDCCVFPREMPATNCADLVVTRPLSGLSAEYGASYVASPIGQAAIGLRETGIAQPHFNIGSMRVKPFPLPPLAEQHEIVRRVEQLFALADRLEAQLAAARTRVDRLTQSILAKAFRGELVPTEADLARRDARPYEPARELLARIRDQQITTKLPCKPRKKSTGE